MRIIGGEAKGRKLHTIELAHLRPMLDRVKESLFNIIRDRVPGACVLDLFSGCGALGMEALSRRAQRCVFVERDPALAQLVRENVELCRMTDRCHVLQEDFLFLPNRRPPEGFGPAGVVFADPPYAMVDDPNARAEMFETLEALLGVWIAADAMVMLHHRPAPHTLWPARRLRCFDVRVYGNSQLSLFDVGEGA